MVIPAHNEAASLADTVQRVGAELVREQIDYEIVVVDDASVDATAEVVDELRRSNERVRYHLSHNPRGFGYAVRAGLDVYTGDAVAVMMADGSDDPSDLVRYYRALDEGYECAFGSRFTSGSRVVGYPRAKLVMNRIVNSGIRVLFRLGYNDVTNAFKAYRRETIDLVQPLLSNHFNLTVEIPLKAIVRGASYTVIPIGWKGRRAGESKLDLREMGSRYAFIVAYVWLEKTLSRGDYRRTLPPPDESASGRASGPRAPSHAR